jgi:ornithine carbamoyltransferase
MSHDFLEVDDLSPAELTAVLDAAAAGKASPEAIDPVLADRGVALLFEKPSARTRVSSEMAVVALGGHPVYLRADDVGIDTRETAEDIARTLASYCSLIAARVFRHGVLDRIAGAVDIPVVNLLSDRGHPCQAVADLLTLQELFGALEGRRLAYVGDGNNVAASLAFGAALTGLELTLSSPPGYELDDEDVDRARNLGGIIDLVADPNEAVKGADAIYTDVWTSMGDEHEADVRREAFAGWQVDARLMGLAGPDAYFLHCLPAHRGEEVTADVLEGPASVVWQQAENRMHVARALFAHVHGNIR